MEWAQNNMSFLVNYPISVLTLLVGALLLPSPRVRRVIFAIVCMIIMIEIGFIAWVAYAQIFVPRPQSKPSSPTISRPTPPRVQKSTPEQPSSADQNGSNTSDQASFYLSSKDNPSIRSTYCLDGEFQGEAQLGSSTITIKLDKANFDLCRYSSDSQRKVFFQVGIGKREDIRSGNVQAIRWSKPLGGDIVAGVPLELSPQSVSFKMDSLPKRKKGSFTLSDYGLSVKVFSPDRNGKYTLSSENIFSSQ